MKTRDLSTAQIVFIILSFSAFVLAVFIGALGSVIGAAVFVIIGTVCFVIGMIFSGMDTKPATAPEAKPTSEAKPRAEMQVEMKKADQAAVKKQAPDAGGKPVYKGFPNMISVGNRDFDLIDQFFDVKVEEKTKESVPLGVPLTLTSDNDRIRVISEEKTVGYIRKEKYVRMVSVWQKHKNHARAKAYEADGLKLVVGFFAPYPNKRVYHRSGIMSKSFKLAGVNSEEYEYYASDLSSGEKLEFEYSCYSDRYECVAGFLPHNANDFIEEDSTIGFVDYVESDDDDKLTVYVTVYKKTMEIEGPEELLKKAEESPFEEETYTVKGVTFYTGVSGRKERQGILRAIYFEDPPFDGDYEIVPKVYEYEGEPAVGLYVNGDDHEQIGNIPKGSAAKVAKKMDRYVGSSIRVYGGGEHSWGAEITLKFNKE